MSVLVITGGSRGIGRAIVLGAARRGWSAAFSYVANEAAAEATAAEARALGVACEVLQGDARDEAHLAALFDLGAALGPVDKCVVNAGVIGPAGPLAGMDADRIRRIVDINTTGALLTAREAARRMPAAGGGPGGAIAIVSSAAARLGGANNFVDYAATKGAMDTLTRGLAVELAPSVRVNAVRPGIIETDIHGDAGMPDRAEILGPDQPLGRAGTAEETAAAILWLLSDEASYVTGAIIDVAGGR
ncbi:SDR family oxidoreductase [Pikeienuella piscinae]|uniref:SDR family oxidoreductase n=1 Tax=Pikeienuella piscinae TaxID=2748098 RepID=A0A7L5C0Z6_9RHOB|nr:SDR family oxidoreductase [Pikeienuella piscinae]QIE56457.1 SDR family oxidoreductase [Pikeienuella piscinae]